MKREKVFGIMSGIGAVTTILSTIGCVSGYKKLAMSSSEEEAEKSIKRIKRCGIAAGVGSFIGGAGVVGSSLSVDKMSVEDMNKLEESAREQIKKELEAELEEEEVEEIIIDDSDIEVE